MDLSGGGVAVVGAGGWGTALATLLGNQGRHVRLWCRRTALAEEISATRENRAYLPGVAIPDTVWPSSSLPDVVVGASAVLLVPISRGLRELTRAVAPLLSPDTSVLHASKGLELPSLLRLSEVMEEELGSGWRGRVSVLSGPTHAEEVARGLPTAAVVASRDATSAATFQALLHGPSFRVYTSNDVVGVELCAALKNVVALATGASDGFGFGDNTRATLITRALAEIGRLVHHAGGDQRTVAGLAGMGDLVATCASSLSRNRWAGEQLARGMSLEVVLASTPKVVEGVPAARAAVSFAERLGVEVPVCHEVYRVLYEGAPIRDCLRNLMGREATAEL